jgi:hypothetical protein
MTAWQKCEDEIQRCKQEVDANPEDMPGSRYGLEDWFCAQLMEEFPMSFDSFVTKDSGERLKFESGMQRDVETGKKDYSLCISGPMFERWAALLTRGAEKYERNNWQKARGKAEEERFIRSAFRHFIQWVNGERDEDHAAAVFFNINGAEYVRSQQAKEPNVKRIVTASEEVRKGGAVKYETAVRDIERGGFPQDVIDHLAQKQQEQEKKAAEHKRQCQIAMDNGYASHQVGKRLCDNPNHRGSQDAAYWEEGWRKRHHELCYGKEWGTK